MANKLLKPKRGRVENLPKLAVEDGSLIFAYDTKSPTSTVLVDVGETRYELSAATAKKADDSNALGGSSLQNIVDKINNSTGNGTAFTGLDTTINNKVKLTRANGGTVEKIINNVSNASTADYAKTAAAGTANYLYRNPVSRPSSANLAITGLGGLRTFKATGSMTEGKPPIGDSHIIHLDWDNTGGWDAQIAVEADGNGHMAVRGMGGSVWGSWNTILDSANYTSYAAKKNAYNSASVSNATIALGRSDGSTGTTLTVNNVANASTAKLAWDSNALGGSSLKNINDRIDSAIAANDAMHYIGTLGTSGTITTLPSTARIGDAYKVINDGTFNGIAAETGDLFIYSSSGWNLIPSGDDGNVFIGDTKSSKFPNKSNNIVIAVGNQKVSSAANVTANAGTISALQGTFTQLKANQGTVTTLNGSKATFDTFNGRLKGDSDATYFVRSVDTRSVNTLPSTYISTYGMGSKEEFKESTVIGLADADKYSHVITHIPWGDHYGGRPFQVAYSGTKMFTRGSASDSAWGEWYKVITGEDALASSASAISSTNNYFTAGATTALIAAKTASAVGNYLPLAGGTMNKNAFISWPNSGNWPDNAGVTFPVSCGGFDWSGQSDSVKLYVEETGSDNLELIAQFGDDNSNGFTIRNASNNQVIRLAASGAITGGSLGVSGGISGGSLSVTGKISGNTLSLSGAGIYLNRGETAGAGQINWYSSSFKNWVDYMAPPRDGFAPTGGKPSTFGDVTNWARRSIIESTSGYGWIWEASSVRETGVAATVTPDPLMSLGSATGNLKVKGTVTATTVNAYLNGNAKNADTVDGFHAVDSNNLTASATSAKIVLAKNVVSYIDSLGLATTSQFEWIEF